MASKRSAKTNPSQARKRVEAIDTKSASILVRGKDGSAFARWVAKEAGEKWKSMTNEEKKPYHDKVVELKVEYEKAMEAYNAENEAQDVDEGSTKKAKEKEVEEEDEKSDKGVMANELEEVTDEE